MCSIPSLGDLSTERDQNHHYLEIQKRRDNKLESHECRFVCISRFLYHRPNCPTLQQLRHHIKSHQQMFTHGLKQRVELSCTLRRMVIGPRLCQCTLCQQALKTTPVTNIITSDSSRIKRNIEALSKPIY